MLNTQRLLLLAWDNLGVGIIVVITTRDNHYYDEDDIVVDGPKNKVEDVQHTSVPEKTAAKPKETKPRKSKFTKTDLDLPDVLEIPLF